MLIDIRLAATTPFRVGRLRRRGLVSYLREKTCCRMTPAPPHAFQKHSRHLLIPCPLRPCFRSEEHTSELQSRENLVCRLLLEKKKIRVQPLCDAFPSVCL